MTSFLISCPDENSTLRFGETLALALRSGDSVWLEGDLGAGKTTLARAVIRTVAGDDHLEVPSPTFTIMQIYEDMHFGQLAHLDLYRIEDGAELDELGLDEILSDGVALIEWPQKAVTELPSPSLKIALSQGSEDDGRVLEVSGDEKAVARVARSSALRKYLDDQGDNNSRRQHLTGDASSRAYETVHREDGSHVILMNAPAQPDGPPIRDGKPYSKIANLAEDMSAFAGMAVLLEEKGLRVPKIYELDLDEGILLIEDLGAGVIIDEDRVPIADRYMASVETLAALHEKTWQTDIPLPNDKNHHVPPFDKQAMSIEVELLIDWYFEWKTGEAPNQTDRSEFQDIWSELIDLAQQSEQSLVLRDYHSPNIIWMNEAEGTDRIGLIDFQDGLIGPTAYDVASLAQDARVDISKDLETQLLNHYCELRAPFDEKGFRSAYAIMAAQRVTKVLGIFVRLSKRDGKDVYLAHLPRMEDYLARSLAHPTLARYRHWVKTVLHRV